MARDKFLDSIKFILVLLVVWGHLFERNIDERTNLIVYGFLGSFVMPLFIFISGYLSKNITWRKYKTSFVSLMGTYIVFQTLFFIPRIISGKFEIYDYLTNPIGGLWYLIGLIIWRFMAYLILTKMSFLPVFSLFIGICLLLGFLGVGIPFSRILIFFPFFILGYYCTSEIIQKIRNINKIYTLTFALLFFIYIYFYIDVTYHMNLFGEEPYKVYPGGIWEGFLYRVALYVIAIAMSICFLTIATDKFYKYGSSSLVIYLLHPIFLQFIYLAFPVMNTIKTNIFIDFLLANIIAILSLYVSRFKAIQYLVNPVLLFTKKKKVMS